MPTRRARVRAALVAAALAGSGLAGRAQVQTPAPATISGTVVDAVTARPVPHAAVRWSRLSGGVDRTVIATADDDGHFVLTMLTPGQCRVFASAKDFFQGEVGQDAYPGVGRPVLAEAGEVISDLVVRIWPPATLQGRVVDTTGASTPASVFVLHRANDWDRTWTPVRPDATATDASGAYTFEHLEPGTYAVLAWPPAASLPAASSFAPTFAPAAARVADLTGVAVASGDRRDMPDLQVRRRTTIVIAGHLVGSPDQIAGALVRACPTDAGLRAIGRCLAETRASADGAYLLTGLVAGTYMIEAQVSRPDGHGISAWGRRAASLGTSAENGDVQMQPPFTIAGDVVLKPSGSESPDGLTVAVRVMDPLLMPLEGEATGDPIETKIDHDGRFAVEGLAPGEYLFSDRSGGAGWTLISAIVANRDVADVPLSLDEGVETPRATVTLSHATTELSGIVRTAMGEVAPRAAVVVFATDPQFWQPHARRVRVVYCDGDGSFVFQGLPPGDYYIWCTGAADVHETAAFLEAAVPDSRKIQVMNGESSRVELTLPAR